MRTTEREVLVAVDLGAGSDEAIVQADAWARRIDARLVVCHALPDVARVHPLLPHLAAPGVIDVAALRARITETLAERVSRLTGRGPGDVQVGVDEGAAAATILRVADERRPEVIVIGHSEKRVVERAVLGSTAEQIVRHAHHPVLVARPSPDSGIVLAATDFSEAAEPAIAAAARRAAAAGARLILLHALELPSPAIAAFDASAVLPTAALESLHQACRATLEATLAGLGVAGEVRVVEGPPGLAIPRAAADLSAQVLVVGTHGRTGLKRFALGSVASTVVRRAPCSVLVVRS